MWITSLIGKLIGLPGVRITVVGGIALLAIIIGLGAQLRPMDTSSATHLAATPCAGQKPANAGNSPCLTGNDLLANSIARAASVALQPTVTSNEVSQEVALANQAPNTIGQPCHDAYMFVPNISAWTVPPGCYANIYTPDRTQYSAPSTFGYCNWWVEALHPRQPDILTSSRYARTSTPIVGAAVWFPPNVQGASSAGHWAQLVAIGPDHYWLLITEMNFGWRGGGFGKVDYRYVHVGDGILFVH